MADLTPRQERALTALLSEPNVRAAALQSGTAERTLYRWLADPTFRTAYRQCSRRLLEDATGRLRAVAGEALETLRTALQAGNEHVRVRSAVALLELAVKVEVDELAARVEALERSYGESARKN